MRKIIYIAVLVISGIFTSCTDSSKETEYLLEAEAKLKIGVEDAHNPDDNPDE